LIRVKELKIAVRALRLMKMISHIDEDGSGTVDFSQQEIHVKKLNKRSIAFRLFDGD
jgi:hypothetical protein